MSRSEREGRRRETKQMMEPNEGQTNETVEGKITKTEDQIKGVSSPAPTKPTAPTDESTGPTEPLRQHPSWARAEAKSTREDDINRARCKMWGDVCVDSRELERIDEGFRWPCCGARGYRHSVCSAPDAEDPNPSKHEKY